jgi:hypothetical protein
MYRLLEKTRPARKIADLRQEAAAIEAANRLGSL